MIDIIKHLVLNTQRPKWLTIWTPEPTQNHFSLMTIIQVRWWWLLQNNIIWELLSHRLIRWLSIERLSTHGESVQENHFNPRREVMYRDYQYTKFSNINFWSYRRGHEYPSCRKNNSSNSFWERSQLTGDSSQNYSTLFITSWSSQHQMTSLCFPLHSELLQKPIPFLGLLMKSPKAFV